MSVVVSTWGNSPRALVSLSNERSASALEAPSVSDIGLTHKDIHEARQIRDAEEADPGIVRRYDTGRLMLNATSIPAREA